MDRGWLFWASTMTGTVVLTVVALPLAVLAVCALALRRRAKGWRYPWRLSLADVGLVYGTLPWLWITLEPGSGAWRVPGRTSLVPFADILDAVAHGAVLGIVGNMLVLAAVGAFGPVRFAALATLPRIVLFAACCSTAIEVAQYVFQLDRVSSVDDVLLNTLGAAMAALVSRPWWRVREEQREPVLTG
ncbi:VanZ family protein [Crossiella equi]|uniref:VanZ family protein n=1 Tax=Crossiella equi TaxID=130796 RepID=A0ABS5A5S2_9PSEU|nr:VanZ family protein [Crossiella equi]MBP2471953.1 VanZ family protein [Crossiella equi]